MKRLSPEDIEVARRKVLRNAVALLRDARLLFRHRRYPRAYALAHLASEEVVKLPMLVRAGLQSQTGSPFAWTTLGKRLQSHKAKLRQAAVSDYMLDLDMANDRDLGKLKAELASIGEANDLKNSSLYSGVTGDRFMSPREAVSADAARAMLDRSASRLAFYIHVERLTRGSVARANPANLEHLSYLLKALRGRS